MTQTTLDPAEVVKQFIALNPTLFRSVDGEDVSVVPVGCGHYKLRRIEDPQRHLSRGAHLHFMVLVEVYAQECRTGSLSKGEDLSLFVLPDYDTLQCIIPECVADSQKGYGLIVVRKGLVFERTLAREDEIVPALRYPKDTP